MKHEDLVLFDDVVMSGRDAEKRMLAELQNARARVVELERHIERLQTALTKFAQHHRPARRKRPLQMAEGAK